ncbi:peptidase M24, partial [Schizopora paradoxa]
MSLAICRNCLQALKSQKIQPQRHYATTTTIPNFSKPAKFGQPRHASHPHLLKDAELTPGFTPQEYASRRSELMKRLPESSMVVCLSAPVKYMSGEIFYKYRQASDFWYLTGFEEPESAVVLEKISSGSECRMTLFSRGKDPAKEKWEGPRTGFIEAAKIFNANEARPIEDLPSMLKSLAPLYSNIYVDSQFAPQRRGRPRSVLKYLSSATSKSDSDGVMDVLPSSKRLNLAPELAKLRSIKSPAEIRAMRNAADVSGRAHAKTMRFAEPGLPESALAAHFEYLCALSGSQRLAYVPVVASGSNALIIHYTNNNQVIRDDEFVLIDAGCELNGYASDITRTFPASGAFSSEQMDLYSAVLTAQKACIDLCTEASGMSLNDLHRKSCEILRQELQQLGFNLTVGLLERELYPHYLSHPLGIDLHESSHFDRGAQLKEGMVITIEPGIYVPPSSAFPKHFHNMGIRIEDEVLIGKNHPTVLSVAAPKEIADVEGACQGLLGLKAH